MAFKMALVQMSVVGGAKFRNLDRAVELVNEAAVHGSQIAVLPEALDLGWTHPSSLREAEPIPSGEPFCRLAQVATARGIYVCAGLTEQFGGQVYNAAVIIGRHGELLCIHRKINELDIGHPYYAQGDRLNVVTTDLGTLGLMICADGFAKDQVLSRSLGYMGADLVLSPCAWAVPAAYDNEREPYGDLWRRVYGPVAKDFRMWIVGVSNVGPIEAGPWAGRKCIGCSLVVGPDGAPILQGPYGEYAETILYVDVETVQRPARGCEWEAYFGKSPGASQP